MAELKALELLLAHGKISRRDFSTRLSALGITTALSPTFFCAPAQAKNRKKVDDSGSAWAVAQPLIRWIPQR